MVKDFIKTINKSPQKEQLLDIIEDIYHNNLGGYDVKPLQGKRNHYRIRKGEMRIIFVTTSRGNEIVTVAKRGDVYKNL